MISERAADGSAEACLMLLPALRNDFFTGGGRMDALGGHAHENRGGSDRASVPALDPHVASSVDRPRVLVVGGNLLTAESVTLALHQLTFVARFAVPITLGHLRDLVAWEPTVALVDIESIETNLALEVIAILSMAGTAVVAMTGSTDHQLAGRYFRAGASFVIDKSSSLTSLAEVMERTLTGRDDLLEASRQPVDSEQQRLHGRSAQLAAFDVLTHREKFVLAELMEGHTPEAIAIRSSVSISTVRSQIKALLQKLGVNSHLAAAALARKAGWSFVPAPTPADVARLRSTSTWPRVDPPVSL